MADLPPFEGNPMKSYPPGTHVRVWTQEGAHEYVGRFSTDDPMRFEDDSGRMGMTGVGYCRIENADTGEVYYDNGWWR